MVYGTVYYIHKCFYFPQFPTCWNCLNTFYACPRTQEQLERSYQVFFYICIIVDIPHSVALKFKFLTTNSEQKGALCSEKTNAGRRKRDTICIVVKWHRGRLQGIVGPQSIISLCESKSRPPVCVALHVWDAGAVRLFQHRSQVLISYSTSAWTKCWEVTFWK